MKQYADYGFYKNNYKGTMIKDEAAFDRMSIEASFYVNECTLGRIKEPLIEEIKLATCAVADVTHNEYVQNNGDHIASESVGPHSVSYAKNTKTADEFEKEKQRVVKLYLQQTGLLYRGIPSWNF